MLKLSLVQLGHEFDFIEFVERRPLRLPISPPQLIYMTFVMVSGIGLEPIESS